MSAAASACSFLSFSSPDTGVQTCLLGQSRHAVAFLVAFHVARGLERGEPIWHTFLDVGK